MKIQIDRCQTSNSKRPNETDNRQISPNTKSQILINSTDQNRVKPNSQQRVSPIKRVQE